MQDMEQATREHAYHLWIADGCPDGNAEKYWLTAQREVLAASLQDIGRVKVGDAQRAARAKSKKAAANDATAARPKAKRKVA
jgi:Protein of unknown function (DUF2934)